MHVSLWRKTRKIKSFWIGAFTAIIFCVVGNAEAFQGYNVVVTTNPTVQASFLASTTAQFQATLTPNPLVANTYSINLLGANPSYNPPPTTIQQALSLGATVYLYGWVDGQHYERAHDEGIASVYAINCSSPTVFTLHQTSTATFDTATCQDAIGMVYQQIYQQDYSTPTAVNY